MFLDTLKSFAWSKKFLFTLVITFVVLIACHYGVLPKEDASTFLKILWPAYLVAQGIADVGAKQAEASLLNARLYSETDTKLLDQKQAAVATIAETVFKAYMDAKKTATDGDIHGSRRPSEPPAAPVVPSQPKED